MFSIPYWAYTLVALSQLSSASLSVASFDTIDPTRKASVDHRKNVFSEIDYLFEEDSSLLRYPTQFLQGVVPINGHSHNDYWRDVPLLTGLSYGLGSTEADVWLFNGELLVGHDAQALTAQRTFTSLYINPLLRILEQVNLNTKKGDKPHGVFDMAAGRSLQLLVDMKTDGEEAYYAVKEALQPLKEMDYLTTYSEESRSVTTRPVTVIGTGNTPYDLVADESERYIFFDAPLESVTSDRYTRVISPLASTNWAEHVQWDGLSKPSDADLSKLQSLVDSAHDKGIMTRFWGEPVRPKRARNMVWNTLLDVGSDWINADDVAELAEL